eukprot:5430902-Pyramimonas_sp.AAC.1
MTQLGKVAPPNIESRYSLLDRAFLDFCPSSSGGPKPLDRAKRNRDSIFGGATFPNCARGRDAPSRGRGGEDPEQDPRQAAHLHLGGAVPQVQRRPLPRRPLRAGAFNIPHQALNIPHQALRILI